MVDWWAEMRVAQTAVLLVLPKVARMVVTKAELTVGCSERPLVVHSEQMRVALRAVRLEGY